MTYYLKEETEMSMSGMFHSDTPITRSQDDLLGRKVFARQLGQAILSQSGTESLNIGLYGEWGSGKTSIINMVEESIRAAAGEAGQQEPVIVRFNPWLFADQVQLTTQFFKQISNAYKKSSAVKAIGEFMEALGAAFELADAVPVIGAQSGVIAKLMQLIGKGMAGGIVSPDIQEVKNRIAAELKKKNVQTIIMIDDIDRLSNQEIRAVFQLVKSIADFPNTVYLLAFDYEIVTRALGEVQNTDGAKYLEKIIQVPFHLPVLNEQQLTDLFLRSLSLILRDIPEERFNREKWALLYHNGIRPFLKTMRDAIRFNNTFSLKYSFLKDEVDVIDLVGITAIQVFEPELYKLIAAYKNEFCGRFSSYISSGGDREQDSFQALYQSMLKGLPEEQQKYTAEILGVLFPKVQSIAKVWSGDVYFDSYEAIRRGNIYNSNYFDRYFSLDIQNSLSLAQAQHIVLAAEEESLEDLLLDLDSRRLANQFLTYLEAVLGKLKGSGEHGDRVFLLLHKLSSLWEQLHDADADQFFAYPWTWRLVNITLNALQTLPDQERRLVEMEKLFRAPDISLGVKLQQLLALGQEHGRYQEKQEENTARREPAALSADGLRQLEGIYWDALRRAVQEKTLLGEEGFPSIKWFMDTFAAQDLKGEFQKYWDDLKKTDGGLARLIPVFVAHGKAAGTFVYSTWKVDLKEMAEQFSVEQAVERMAGFSRTDGFRALPRKIQEDVLAFLTFYELKEEALRESVTLPAIKEYVEKHELQLDFSL